MAASETGSAAWPGRLPGSGSTVSVLVATAIVVADMVGVGVFTSLGFQVKDIPSGFSILLLWVVGGVVALCGVFSYSELGAMFPRSSGEYNFLTPRVSSGARISGGLGVGDGRLRGAGGAGRDGVRRIRQVGAAGRPAAGARRRRGLAGVAGATRRGQTLQHLSADRDHPEGGADRQPSWWRDSSSAPRSRSRSRLRFPTSPISPARRSRSGWCS